MRVLSVGGSYRPVNGGNAKRISTMCEAFVSLGNSVTVCTCSKSDNGSEKENINGVSVLRFDNWEALSASIKGLTEDLNIDIVLVHEETYLRRLKSAKIKAPIVYECHAIEPNRNKLKEFILKALRRFYFNPEFVKSVFVLSQNAKKQFAQGFGYPENLIFYTPNGVEKTSYSEKPMSFGNNKDFIYGYSGTLYEFQGIRILMKYCKDILAIADDVKIMIVGGGPLETEVKEYVAQNGLEERIILTGSVNREMFDELTSEFDVMVLPRPSTPSTESAVPLKIFDAAIHKKPVVMSNVSGLTEAFGEKAALIYDTKNPDGFVDCCKKIYRNTELAEKLVEGEEEALKNWPTVADVAKAQLDAMEAVLKK